MECVGVFFFPPSHPTLHTVARADPVYPHSSLQPPIKIFQYHSYKGKGNKLNGKPGYVYKLGLRNGKANVDEYSPIYSPEEYKTDGDKYEGDLRLAAAAVVGVVGTGALAILLTSSL